MKEAKKSKRHWLSGNVLGVSMALLLSGGVALTQDLFPRIDKNCVEGWSAMEYPTEDQYLLPHTIGGWVTGYIVCARTTVDGEVLFPGSCTDEYPPTDHDLVHWGVPL